jgi:hypothetical protein
VLAVSTGITIALNMTRIIYEIPILYFLVPIVVIAFFIMPLVPRLFVGIAFDSGGVATGTITAAFAVPFALGVCNGLGLVGENDNLIYGFGMIAFICLMPILTVCALGFVYNLKIIKNKKFVPRMIQQVPKIRDSTAVIVIICKPELETDINRMITDTNGTIMSTMNAQGSSRTPTNALDMASNDKICMIGLINQQHSAKIMGKLEADFDFIEEHSGIAFTVPTEHEFNNLRREV